MKNYYLTPQEYEYLDYLVVQAQQGHAPARRTLYRDLQPVIDGWIRKRFPDEDLGQEAYISLWMEKIPKIITAFLYRRSGLRFYSFLSACVLRALEDVDKTERRRAKIGVYPEDIEWACEGVDANSPLERLISKETLEEVELYASDHLRVTDQMVFGQLLDQDMTQKQLAERLGVTKSCISKREARIRRELSAHLARQESE